MQDESKIEVGMEVLVFNDYRWANSIQNKLIGRAVVTSFEESQDLSYHGTPLYRIIYQIDLKTDDGKVKKLKVGFRWPLYGCGINESYYILTKEDYVSCLKREIRNASNQIKAIEEEVSKLEAEIERY